MNKEKKIYMIDGSAYIYRAYHAIRGLTNSKGFPTNAVLGFTKMLIKLLHDHAPEHIAMFFDHKGKTFRHEIYDDYKANRPPMPEDLSAQIPFIKKITDAFNIKSIEIQGFEADDLIGTCSSIAQSSGFKVIMVTGDKDFMQLVTENAVVWDPMKDKTIDKDSIEKDFELLPGQMIDMMGLAGDKADNVPGVPGIGSKTAVSLIKKFKSIKGIYDNIDVITKKKQHENLVKYMDQAFLSKKLVTIVTDIPLAFKPDDFAFREPDNNKLNKLFKELEFRQLQQALPKKTDLSNKNYSSVLDIKELENLVEELEKSDFFAIDTETTSKNPMKADLVGLSFSLEPDHAFYIPCTHAYPEAPKQLELGSVLKSLKPVLENKNIKKIGQNIKYDWLVLSRHGIDLKGVWFDTMIASYLINPTKRAHNLDQIALDFIDHKTISYNEVTEKKNICFSQVNLEKAVPYACEDADITFIVHNILKDKLKGTDLFELFEKIEMPLVHVLMKMELRGICVDKEKLKSLSLTFKHRIEEFEKNIYSIAGEIFNINSTQQLGKILFEKLGLPAQKKTKKKTGYSTDVNVLTNLTDKHELPGLVLQYRTLTKLKSTYTDALYNLVNPETGRIHTSYNQTVTATGRLSSSNPNLQNIPIRSEEGKQIRSAFIPKKGWHFMSADYSQIELRILAHYSDDSILIKAFNEDEDIHTRTAEEVFQVFPSFITSELRQQAKAINFGIIYGISAFGLSRETGITRKMAKIYIDNYFARYKGVKKFIDQTIEEARKIKKTTTMFGRIRLLPDINSPNKNVREFAERTAINTPVQGTAADLIKIAMINMDSALSEKNLKSAMLLSVHDELIFEVPDEETGIMQTLVKSIMEGVCNLKVPLKVNIVCGKNWAEAH